MELKEEVASYNEDMLQMPLQEEEKDPEDALFESVKSYDQIRHYDEALKCLRELLSISDNLEKKVRYVLYMGALMEKKEDFKAAVRQYRKALRLKPSIRTTLYFSNNNLGFSLNKLGKYKEGEKYCIAATKLIGFRSNAYKNLGVSLEGQLRFKEAAEAYIRAMRADPGDCRSLKHLETLLDSQPELKCEFAEQLRLYRQSVDSSQKEFIIQQKYDIKKLHPA